MKLILIFLGLATWALLSGCVARFSTIQTDRSYDEAGNIQREITTKATATTFNEARSQLANFKASQTDKTQGASVGALTQEASGTNTVEALKAIDSILSKVRP